MPGERIRGEANRGLGANAQRRPPGSLRFATSIGRIFPPPIEEVRRALHRSYKAPSHRLISAPAYQVEDQHDDGDNDENVDERAPDMKGESQQPQNHKNNDDCPKHLFVLAHGRRES